jgi:hypothetical protein
MVALAKVPSGLDEIVACYGNPLHHEFCASELCRMELPFPLRLSYRPLESISVVYVHRLVGPAMVDALHEIMGVYGEDGIREHRLGWTGGIWCKRKKTSSSTEWSVHSWGIAIDYVPEYGPYGKTPTTPPAVVAAFEKRGFVWGGRWRVPDGMHFQACRNY